MDKIEFLKKESDGIYRLKPTWVPRFYCRPGKRIKLHPDDYYVLGLKRGGIDERWFASTTHAENGPDTPFDEGLSYAVSNDGGVKVLLKDLVDALQGELIGDNLWKKYKKWPMFSKFFDNQGPLPHHIHHRDEHAKRIGADGKPEMYFFPAQVNNHGGDFPFTFFGLNPETTKKEVYNCLKDFNKGDNKLLDLARAYKLVLDTGYDVPPGILHAPGSLCTYEPQFASDVYAMYQSVLMNGECVCEDLLWKNCPEEEKGNFDYLLDVIDWEANIDKDFHQNHYMLPIIDRQDKNYKEEWICYKNKTICAKRLTVYPNSEVTVKDGGAYGFIMLEGNGYINDKVIGTPALIRYNELTNDEYFVSYKKAAEGVTIKNTSSCENIVMLKHFAENSDLKNIKL